MRTMEIETRCWSKKERAQIVKKITVRLCDADGCEDHSCLWGFLGNVAYCAAHKHLAGEQS